MAKLSIYEAIWVEREVEVPAACPQCGVSFTSDAAADPAKPDRISGNLIEVDWVNLEMIWHLGPVLKGEAPEFIAEQHGAVGDVYHACLLQCATCREIIVSAGNATLGKGSPVTGETLVTLASEARAAGEEYSE